CWVGTGPILTEIPIAFFFFCVRRRNTVYLAQQKNFSRKNGSIHKKNIFTTEGTKIRNWIR
ncbi:hypothetical protein L9F63_006555, partial [Diploptera punctata]